MSLNRRLDAWLREGVIDADAARRIRAFEDTRKRPTALQVLAGLGALAVGTGLVAIVAANWAAIPPVVKLAVDLLLGATCAYGIDRSVGRARGWSTEALLIVYYLFVLASLGLIGQIYQLGTPLHTALGVWSLATMPLLLLARSRFAGLLWAAGLITTYVINAVHWIDRVKDADRVDLALSLGVALPVLLFTFSWVLRRTSREISRTFEEIAWLAVVGLAFVGTFGWYAAIGVEHLASWGAGLAVLLAAVAIASRRFLFPEHARLAAMSFVVFLTATVLPLVVTHESLELVGGLFGLGVLGFFARMAYQIGHRAAFGVLTAAIGIRIVTIYFEVFGSLMSTGLGLVTGGVLTILIAWLWARTSSSLQHEIQRGRSDAR